MAATTALYDLIAAAAADPTSPLMGVQTTFGLPEQDEEQEVVAVLGFTSAGEEPLTVGPMAQRLEQFDLDGAVKVYDPTEQDAAVVFGRVMTLVDAIRDVVALNVTLNDTVLEAYFVGRRSEGGGIPRQPIGDSNQLLPGLVMRVDFTVHATAVI